MGSILIAVTYIIFVFKQICKAYLFVRKHASTLAREGHDLVDSDILN